MELKLLTSLPCFYVGQLDVIDFVDSCSLIETYIYAVSYVYFLFLGPVCFIDVQIQFVSASQNFEESFKFWRALQFSMQNFRIDSSIITNLHGNWSWKFSSISLPVTNCIGTCNLTNIPLMFLWYYNWVRVGIGEKNGPFIFSLVDKFLRIFMDTSVILSLLTRNHGALLLLNLYIQYLGAFVIILFLSLKFQQHPVFHVCADIMPLGINCRRYGGEFRKWWGWRGYWPGSPCCGPYFTIFFRWVPWISLQRTI